MAKQNKDEESEEYEVEGIVDHKLTGKAVSN